MPIFEFLCGGCGKRFSALVGVIANPKPTACPQCNGVSLEKQVSRFSSIRSEDDVMDKLSEEASLGDVENDPAAMREWMRNMSSAMDEDMDADIEEALEEEFGGTAVGSSSTRRDDTVY